MAKVDELVKGYSPEEVAEGLKLLKKKRERLEKIKRGELKGSVPLSVLRETNPEAYRKRVEQNRRNAIRNRLLMKKAIEAGITVTPEEVEAAMRGAGTGK